MLFVAFLSLHPHLRVRANFIVDIQVTKKRKSDGSKGEDSYDYKKSRKAQSSSTKKTVATKKRAVSPFTQAKMKGKDTLETIDENPEKLASPSEGEKRMNSMLERFAYTPVMIANKVRPVKV